MRCNMSPTLRVSKKSSGSLISLHRKSDMSDMLMRAVTWSMIQPLTKSTAVCDAVSTSCAISMSTMNRRLRPLMPVSTSDCVRNGKISCSTLASTIPAASRPISRP